MIMDKISCALQYILVALLLRGKGGLLHGYKVVKRWAVEPTYVDVSISLLYSQRENPKWWGWP